MILLPLCFTDVTSSIDVVCEEEVQLPDGDIDVIRIDTETRVKTVRRLLQSFPVCTLQRNPLEQDDLHQIKPPHLVGLSETVYPPHLSLLVGIGEAAHGGLLPRYRQHKVLAALLGNVFTELPE